MYEIGRNVADDAIMYNTGIFLHPCCPHVSCWPRPPKVPFRNILPPQLLNVVPVDHLTADLGIVELEPGKQGCLSWRVF